MNTFVEDVLGGKSSRARRSGKKFLREQIEEYENATARGRGSGWRSSSGAMSD